MSDSYILHSNTILNPPDFDIAYAEGSKTLSECIEHLFDGYSAIAEYWPDVGTCIVFAIPWIQLPMDVDASTVPQNVISVTAKEMHCKR